MAYQAKYWNGTSWVAVANASFDTSGLVKTTGNTGTVDLSGASVVKGAGMDLIVPTSVTGGTYSASGAISFSAATAVNVNGCFTSAYQNYLVIIKADMSAADQTGFRLRLAGTDATGSNYKTSWNVATDGGAEDFSSYASTGRTSGFVSASSSAYTFFTSLEISAPQLAVPTLCLGKMVNTQVAQGTTGTIHNVSTAYDGFTLFAFSGNLTGTLRIYGYHN
jgi:hypothetical protein